jgi:Subtilase family
VFGGSGIAGAGATGVALGWTNTKGGGRVDVRDALTGALLYSVTRGRLYDQTGWAEVPGLGLIALDSAAVLIKPGDSVVMGNLSAESATVVGSATRPVLVTGDNYLEAYPASTTRELNGQPAAGNRTFTPSIIVPAGPAAGGQVIALPMDSLAWQTVAEGEEGNGGQPIGTTTETGIDLLTVSGTPPASTAPIHQGAPAPRPRPRPETISLPTPRPGVGTATPQLTMKVRGYTTAGRPVLSGATPAGYDPATIRTYLGLTGDGAGQTIAIVDAYSDPYITSDVDTFSKQFGLPKVCGTPGATRSCFDFTVSKPETTLTDPGWALETSLDVEWAHAIAPLAAITLEETRSPTFARMFSAVTRAAALKPDVISMSWGAREFSGESYYNWHCQLAHSVCVAASGDYGYPGLYPAYNPSVLAVGGTSLYLTKRGTVQAEITWSGSGGGQSYFQAKPAVQRGVAPGWRRGIPDVSYDADPQTGMAVYDTDPGLGSTGWFQVGGTSVGAPSWSAILADADQLRAAAGKPRLTSAGDAAARAVYAATSAIASITSGPPNGACPGECRPGSGWDFITGLGSPRRGVDEIIATAADADVP